jgi:lambda repressor-like predicted transcriptional regulator
MESLRHLSEASSMHTVARWLEIRGIDLAALRQAAALDERTAAAILEGRYTPSPKQRERIAAALAVEPVEICWDHKAGVDHMYGHGPQFGRSP